MTGQVGSARTRKQTLLRSDVCLVGPEMGAISTRQYWRTETSVPPLFDDKKALSARGSDSHLGARNALNGAGG